MCFTVPALPTHAAAATTFGRGYASPEPLILRATALQQQGKHDAALSELETCIGRWPECARAYAERGKLLADAGAHAEALSDFT